MVMCAPASAAAGAAVEADTSKCVPENRQEPCQSITDSYIYVPPHVEPAIADASPDPPRGRPEDDLRARLRRDHLRRGSGRSLDLRHPVGRDLRATAARRRASDLDVHGERAAASAARAAASAGQRSLVTRGEDAAGARPRDVASEGLSTSLTVAGRRRRDDASDRYAELRAPDELGRFAARSSGGGNSRGAGPKFCARCHCSRRRYGSARTMPHRRRRPNPWPRTSRRRPRMRQRRTIGAARAAPRTDG